MDDIWTDNEWDRLLGRQSCSWKTPVTPRPIGLAPRPIRRSPPTRVARQGSRLVRPPAIPRAGGLTSLEELSGLRELPGVPLSHASRLRPDAAAQMSRSTDSLIATLVTMPAAASGRPTEATGEIDTNPIRPTSLARRVFSLTMGAAAAVAAGIGAIGAIKAISIEYVGAEWAHAALMMGTMIGAIIGALACRLIAGRRCGAATMTIAGVLGLGMGWATRLAIGGGLAEHTLEQMTAPDLMDALATGAEHAAALGSMPLLLVWACEAILIVWFAAGIGVHTPPSVEARNA